MFADVFHNCFTSETRVYNIKKLNMATTIRLYYNMYGYLVDDIYLWGSNEDEHAINVSMKHSFLFDRDEEKVRQRDMAIRRKIKRVLFTILLFLTMDPLDECEDAASVADTDEALENVVVNEEVDTVNKRKRSEWDKINLRFKKLATVSLFVQILNEVDEDWRSDPNLVRRTVEWTKRAATD